MSSRYDIDKLNRLENIKKNLFKLPTEEVLERVKTKADYYIYQGKCEDEEAAKDDKALLGQSWETKDNTAYEPTQDIRNKIKPLLKKQARFMFGKEPTIVIKADDPKKDKEECENLRKFLDDVFEKNNFWTNTKKAFLESTIKKRVLLRAEVIKGQPIKLKYEKIEDFFYKEIGNILMEVSFFEEDLNNVYINKDDEKKYYIHKYNYGKNGEVLYTKLTYEGGNTDPSEIKGPADTGLIKIPCWLIKNGGELNSKYGESDIEDLKDAQDQYNRRNSDLADALKFQLFGAEAVIDGDEEDVNNFTVSPGAVHAVKTRDDVSDNRQAVIQRLEYNLGSADVVNSYLDRAEKDMRDALDMPNIKDLNNIPSAKAMKYLYNDLIVRCEEKWNDWEPVLKDVVNLIMEYGLACYTNYNKNWNNIKFTLDFKHNYPLPSDEEDKKKVAMEEVQANVRSVVSYIQEYSDSEDPQEEFNTIVEEKRILAEAEADSFNKALKSEGTEENNDNEDDEDKKKNFIEDDK